MRGCRLLERGRARGASASRRLRCEALEVRRLLAFDPTPFEQELLEWANHLRQHPAAALERLVDRLDPLHSPDADVQSALDYFQVDGELLASQWASLAPAQPLAWNEALYNAARGHNQAMLDADEQSHQVPGELSLSQRITAAGYPTAGASWGLGENVFAYAESAIHAHAGFAIDWGFGPGGMQTPAGHRANLMNGSYREAGIAVLASTPGKEVGPYLVTQDFGYRSNMGSSYLLGVVYDDANENGFYNAGEGLAGVSVTAVGAGGTYATTSLSAGGYQFQAAAGTYEVTFSGGGLAAPIVRTVTIGGTNVKVDALVQGAAGGGDPTPPAPVVLEWTLAATSVAEGRSLTATVTRSGDLSQSLVVRLSSSDAGEASLPSLVTIAAGQATATFRLQGVEDGVIDGRVEVQLRAEADGAESAEAALVVRDRLPAGFVVQEDRLIVTGTSGADAFRFTAGDATHTVALGSVVRQIDAERIRSVVFAGGGGSDRLDFTGGSAADTADLGPNGGSLESAAYRVTLESVETVVAIGGRGEDSATLRDAAGNDTLTALPASVQLRGAGYTLDVRNFARVLVLASGGTDTATLNDSAGDDLYTGTPESGLLLGAGFRQEVRGFDRVLVRATLGNDRATLYDSLGNDTFSGSAASSRLRGPGFDHEVRAFDTVYALASEGADAATLSDSTLNDTLTATAEAVTLANSTAHVHLNGRFDTVTAASSAGGRDRARLYDAEGLLVTNLSLAPTLFDYVLQLNGRWRS